MLRAESHLHAIIPRGRLRQRGRGRGRAHDISTAAAAPRFLVGSRRSAAAAGSRRLLTGGHRRRPFAASSGGTPQRAGGASGPSSDGGGSMSSSAPLLGAEEAGGGEPAPAPRPSSWSWVERVVDTAEARAQLRFAVPMVVTSMAYYGIPLVSVMFSGHLGDDVHLAGATLGNSWATVTGYAFVVRVVLYARARARARGPSHLPRPALFAVHASMSLCVKSPIHSRSPPPPLRQAAGRDHRTHPPPHADLFFASWLLAYPSTFRVPLIMLLCLMFLGLSFGHGDGST